MTDEQKAAAYKEWESTIKPFFTPGERGGMLDMTYIHPRLDLWNMESVVLHAYDCTTGDDVPEGGIAYATFKDDLFIYPHGVRTAPKPDGTLVDFNWKAGIITRVIDGGMPSGGPRWTDQRCATFKTWVEAYWPPIDPSVDPPA